MREHQPVERAARQRLAHLGGRDLDGNRAQQLCGDFLGAARAAQLQPREAVDPGDVAILGEDLIGRQHQDEQQAHPVRRQFRLVERAARLADGPEGHRAAAGIGEGLGQFADRTERQLVADIGRRDIADVEHAALRQRQHVLGLAHLLGRKILEGDSAARTFGDLVHPVFRHVLGDIVPHREAVADPQRLGRGGQGRQAQQQRRQAGVSKGLQSHSGSSSLKSGYIVEGSHSTMAGKATRIAITTRWAKTCGMTPRNSSATGRCV